MSLRQIIFVVTNVSLESKEKTFVKFCPVAFVAYEICGLFMCKIPIKNVQKMFFFSSSFTFVKK